MKIAIGVGHHLEEVDHQEEQAEAGKVAQLLHNLLVINGFRAEVFIGKLPDKVRSINAYDADIALDCHFNRLHWPYTNEFGSGFEVCVWPTSSYGHMLASHIIQSMENRLPFERRGKFGIQKRNDLYFLKHTVMPALILEPLFLDNPIERQFLRMKRGHEFIAMAAFNGITEYFKERP